MGAQQWQSCERSPGHGRGRGTQIDVWALEQTIDRGYAVATVYCGDIDPDRSDVREGIQKYIQPKATGPDAWGTIAAWAWGLQRLVDYLVTDPDIDARRIIIVGHSRLGKTAALAAAFDERVAMAIPFRPAAAARRRAAAPSANRSSASTPPFPTGSTAPSRNSTIGPTGCRSISTVSSRSWRRGRCYWPTPWRITWANPAGQFEVLKAAEPVYKLLGAAAVVAAKMPEPGHLVNSTLGYYIREGTHSMTCDDWKIFADYADKQLPTNDLMRFPSPSPLPRGEREVF